MLRMSGLVILTFALLLPGLSVYAAEAPDLTGRYTCVGTNPGGGTYRGTVSITKKGELYLLTWTISPRETYKGLGIVQDNVLAVSFYSRFTGVVAYKIEQGAKKLVGKWAVADGPAKAFPETLTRQ